MAEKQAAEEQAGQDMDQLGRVMKECSLHLATLHGLHSRNAQLNAVKTDQDASDTAKDTEIHRLRARVDVLEAKIRDMHENYLKLVSLPFIAHPMDRTNIVSVAGHRHAEEVKPPPPLHTITTYLNNTDHFDLPVTTIAAFQLYSIVSPGLSFR